MPALSTLIFSRLIYVIVKLKPIHSVQEVRCHLLVVDYLVIVHGWLIRFFLYCDRVAPTQNRVEICKLEIKMKALVSIIKTR